MIRYESYKLNSPQLSVPKINLVTSSTGNFEKGKKIEIIVEIVCVYQYFKSNNIQPTSCSGTILMLIIVINCIQK